jgi:hypothetical protein
VRKEATYESLGVGVLQLEDEELDPLDIEWLLHIVLELAYGRVRGGTYCLSCRAHLRNTVWTS